MTKVLENSLCIINYSESLSELANDTVLLLDKKIKEYKMLFDYSSDEKVTVNYFDTVEDFRNFIYEIRGEKNSFQIML